MPYIYYDLYVKNQKIVTINQLHVLYLHDDELVLVQKSRDGLGVVTGIWNFLPDQNNLLKGC